MMNGKTVTFGEVIMRMSPPGNRKMRQSNQFEFYFGGTEMNVATSLACFGSNVQHVSVVSDDFVGEAALLAMKANGIDVSEIRKNNHPLGLYFLEAGSAMRATQITYNRLHGSFANINPEDYNWDEILKGCDWLHWTGISPAISENAYQALKAALLNASKKEITITADPAYRSNLWHYGRNGREVLAELTALSTIFVGGTNEINEILGTNFRDEKNGFMNAGEALINKYPRVKKVFDKVRTGVSASHQRIYGRALVNDHYLETQEIEITDVVDRIGTGDAFAAGLIYGLKQHYTDQDALNFANAACALKHTLPGESSLAAAAEVQEIVAGNSGGRIKR